MSIRKTNVVKIFPNKDSTYMVVTYGRNCIKYWAKCEVNEWGDYNPLIINEYDGCYIFGINLFEGSGFHSQEVLNEVLDKFLSGKTINRRILLIGLPPEDIDDILIEKYKETKNYDD